MKTKHTPTKPKQPTAAQLADSLIISVGEARKILGTEANGLSDEELVVTIYELSELAQAMLKATLSSSERLL
jgi:hypothetical protein